MYTQYWHLNEKPFELTPDPRYLYFSREHEEALMRLIYTVKDLKGAMLLTGLYGCGKTVLSRVFLNELNTSKYEIALITNPRLSANELLKEIIYQLGAEKPETDSKGELLRAFNEIVYSHLNMHKDTVIVIDEAQAIQDLGTFEELRLLLNFQQDSRFLITLILIGQSELRIKMKKLPQLKQRFMIEYHLNPLNKQDTNNYIDHRLKISGAQEPLFDTKAKAMIYHYSSGVPRIISGIADMALLEGYVSEKKEINESIIRKVVNDAQLEKQWSA